MEHREETLTTSDIAGTQTTEERDREAGRFDRSPQDADAGTDPGSTPLLPDGESGTFQGRWESIQTGFVDEPRRAVEQADELVATVMKRIADGFAEERQGLEAQWSRGEDISTEDLRVALQRYRSFFERLLSA